MKEEAALPLEFDIDVVPETCNSDSMQPTLLIAMWAPDEKNPKVPIPSRIFFPSFFKYCYGLKEKFCLP